MNYDQRTNRILQWIQFFSVVGIIMIFFFAGYSIYIVDQTLHEKTKDRIVLKEHVKIKKYNDSFRIMYHDTIFHLEHKRYNDAQSHLIDLLNIYPYRHDVRRTLVKVLIHQCEIKGKFCKYLDQQVNYLTKINKVTAADLNKWRKELGILEIKV